MQLSVAGSCALPLQAERERCGLQEPLRVPGVQRQVPQDALQPPLPGAQRGLELVPSR